jgi:hypothetical protein
MIAMGMLCLLWHTAVLGVGCGGVWHVGCWQAVAAGSALSDSTIRALEQDVERQLPKLGRELPQVREREVQIKQWLENKSTTPTDKLAALADFCLLEVPPHLSTSIHLSFV